MLLECQSSRLDGLVISIGNTHVKLRDTDKFT